MISSKNTLFTYLQKLQMSGGNNFYRSDFGIASKWYFNWVSHSKYAVDNLRYVFYEKDSIEYLNELFILQIPKDSIVLMQPEGSTAACPTCMSSGTFTLNAFDDWWREPTSSNDLRGIHIPVFVEYSEEWDTNIVSYMSRLYLVIGIYQDNCNTAISIDTHYNSPNLSQVYSYWLSYRTGNDYSTNGLSLHMTYFELGDSTFGAWHDSMNYDATGFTDNKADSFVSVGSCYHMSPPGYLLDRDVVSASAVQPVVCVDQLDTGSSITVSVDFRQDVGASPQPIVDVDEYSMSCSTQAYNVDASKFNLIHVNGMGKDGGVTVSLSSTTGVAGAIFFDE